MINEVDKLWGKEEWLVNNDKYCCKILYLNKGYQCSLHYHKKKDETFYVLEGVIELQVDTLRFNLQETDYFRITPNTLHRFKSITDKSKILEVSTTHYDTDSYRIENSRKIGG